MTVVRVEDLRQMATVLLEHLEEFNGPSIELANDFFWSIPFDSLYDMDSQPADLTIGQLTETVDFLVSLGAERDPVSYGLVWLGDLLRAIGGQARG